MISQQQLQKQQLKISPQQIQLLNFYALNTLEIEHRIKTELEENPFLDCSTEDSPDNAEGNDEINDYEEWDAYTNEDRPDNTYEYQNYLAKEQVPQKPLAYNKDFKEDARQQLNLLSLDEQTQDIAEYLVDMLNEHGLLDRPLDEIAEEYSFQKQKWVDAEDIQNALSIVQTLEPIGIGATSIRECLLTQLRNIESEDRMVSIAFKLVDSHYDELINRQFEKICTALRINNETLKKAFGFLSKLKMYPVSESTSTVEPRQTIIPDFIITCTDDVIQVSLFSSKSDLLFINNSLYEQIRDVDKGKDKAAQKYVQNKIHSAQWFIDTVKQREQTMLTIMKCIVDIQKDYFMEGDILLLKPMVLRNISDITGYDLSTISRITSNKYAETHFGTICLKDLFSEGIADQTGKVISSKVIQSIIKETIDNEDKSRPYTDQQLVNLLSSMGYNIARRTVAKYRELLSIPVAQIRHVLV